MEDAPHVWRCKGEGTEDVWNKSLSELEAVMRRLDTDPTLQHIIILYLKSWWLGEEVTYEAPREFMALLQTQNSIGWDRFFEGWFSTSWAQKQQHYYNITRSTRTGCRWAVAILQKFWNTAWDLWEHCNGILHQKENHVTHSMTTQLNARVSRVYNQLHSRTFHQHDRHLVFHSLYTLLRKDSTYKVTWLTVAEPVLQEERLVNWRARTRSDRMVAGMRRSMFSWLRR